MVTQRLLFRCCFANMSVCNNNNKVDYDVITAAPEKHHDN